MLQNDYECPMFVLNLPFEIDVRNKHNQTRLREIKLNELDNIQPFAQRNIIRMNSTYLELLDTWDDIRGRPTARYIPAFLLSFFGLSVMLYGGVHAFNDSEYLICLGLIPLIVLFISLHYSFYKMSKADLFGYTHYPIRFNRKTQKVYAYSPYRNKVVELNWKNIRFSEMSYSRCFNNDIRASIVDENNTVIEEIVLFKYINYLSKDVESKIAFLKLYMEGENVDKVNSLITEFFPIYNRKETRKETIERLYLTFNHYEWETNQRVNKKDLGGMFVDMLFAFPLFFLRRMGLIFSKTPQWPVHIEKECEIEENDPYDSIHTIRKLSPIHFSLVDICVLVLGCIVMLSLAGVFFVGVAYWGYHR